MRHARTNSELLPPCGTCGEGMQACRRMPVTDGVGFRGMVVCVVAGTRESIATTGSTVRVFTPYPTGKGEFGSLPHGVVCGRACERVAANDGRRFGGCVLAGTRGSGATASSTARAR